MSLIKDNFCYIFGYVVDILLYAAFCSRLVFLCKQKVNVWCIVWQVKFALKNYHFVQELQPVTFYGIWNIEPTLFFLQRHLANADPQSSPKEKNSKSELKSELKRTQEELMTSKLREAGALSHLKDAKQKIMELETSVCTYACVLLHDYTNRGG